MILVGHLYLHPSARCSYRITFISQLKTLAVRTVGIEDKMKQQQTTSFGINHTIYLIVLIHQACPIMVTLYTSVPSEISTHLRKI